MANQNDDRFDGVKKVATAALALGAGAAFLYRGGGDELLSKSMRRASRALNDTVQTMSKETLSSINGRGKQFLTKSIDDFKSSYVKYGEMKETLRIDNPRSLLNSIQIEHSLMDDKGRERLLRQMYQQKFNTDLKVQLQQNEALQRLSPKKLNNIVDNISTHISESFKYAGDTSDDFKLAGDNYELTQKFKDENFGALTENESDTVSQIIQDRFKAKKEESLEWINNNQELVDNITDELTSYDNLAEKHGTRNDGRQRFLDDLLGDRQATLREIVDNADQFERTDLISEGTQNPMEVLERARQLINKDERYGDLLVDKTLRINKFGEIRSFAEAAELEAKGENAVLHSLVGKIIKPLENRVYRNNADNLIFSGAGSVDYILPKLLEGRDSTILANSYIRLNNRGFRINGTQLERIAAMDDVYPVSGQYGSNVRLYKNITGDVDYSTKQRGYFASKLDIGSSPKMGALQNLSLKINKYTDPSWEPNIISKTLSGYNNIANAEDFFQDMREVNRFFKKATKKLDTVSVARLSKNVADDNTKEMFGLLQMDNKQLLKAIGNNDFGTSSKAFINQDLASLVSRYKRDPKKAINTLSISTEIADLPVVGRYTKAEGYTDLLRKEISKEAFLRYEKAYGGDDLIRLIDSAELSGKQKSQAKNLAHWALFQKESGINTSSVNPPTQAFMEASQKKVLNLFTSDPETAPDKLLIKDFKESVARMAKEGVTSLDEAGAPQAYLDTIEKANRPNSHIYVRKAINPLDVIQNLNNTEKTKAFFKQFTAGRNNMEDFTSMSFYPYFGLFRLTDAMPKLAFSPSETGDVASLAKNIMLKRVAPIAGAGFALSYMNYESENLFGKSLTEAAATSFANFDLGIRSIQDTFGISEHLKDIYYTNPAAQYYSEEEHRTVEEQREWFQNGKSAVRKGRWWGLLSNSEYRGGKVEYFEHNYLKQASTQWRDIGVYGSSEEKWKHSLIPTLRHPLSTLRYLSNPYWLEEKNKYSRPYAVSAPLFGEGAPWSGIMNMTIGDAIKPQKQMHREVLGNEFVDVRDLIAQQNAAIKSKAGDSYITITGSNSASEAIMGEGGSGSGYALKGGSQFGGGGGATGPYGTASQFIPQGEDLKLNFADKFFLNTLNLGMAMPQLEDINARIKQKAMTRGGAQTNYAKSYDNLIAADTVDIMRSKDVQSDLKNLSSTQEYLTDIGYSAKQLSGIYGFLFEEAIPSKQRYALESASQMSSFSRRFWDESVGSMGGGFMEIARRFFPHENRSITYLNPIRNNMPSWMPERFKHGDPFTQVKKGEMRLPGLAYEAMNNYTPDIDLTLHPYMMGADKSQMVEYFLNKSNADSYFNSMPTQQVDTTPGALQRTQDNLDAARKEVNKLLESGKINRGEFYSDFEKFRILADVAPWSQEYKTLKTQIRGTLTQEQSKEYFRTLDRVEKQSTQHDFFNYNYIGVKTTEQSAYIDKITDKGFTVVGSDKLYTMAGIETTAEALNTRLRAGMKVRLRYEELDSGDPTINTIVYTGADNVNRLLVKDDLATRKSGTAIDAQALATDFQKTSGAIWEAIGHTPIPFFHNKFLKLETARESYENEQVYGTPYATWSHPIKGYIEPAFNKAFNASPTHAAVGMTAFAANIYFSGSEYGWQRKAAQVANILATPGASTGAMVGYGLNLNGKLVQSGAAIGSAVWATGYLATKAHNPIISMGAGATLGKVLGDFLVEGTGNKGAGVGALAGLGISMLKNPDMNIEKMFSKWIPEDTQKRWDMEEYFDRLKYIKYKGLYEKASRMALRKEGTNIKELVNEMEHAEENALKEKQKLLKQKQRLSNNVARNSEYGKELMMKIDSQLVDPVEAKTIKAGEWTKSALAYKQAMDSTLYGLKEDASWAQVLRALPKNDRDYFLEFAKVKDKKEQDKILETISPYKRKILQGIWGRKIDKQESNDSYFGRHKLPGMFWDGWKPNVDMDHIQMKTIENEGMMLSDFGFYDSNMQEPGVETAPEIRNYNEGDNLLTMKTNLMTSLNGLGLTGVNVSVTPSQKPGIQMAVDIARITDYRIKEKINETFGRTYY